MFSGARIAIWVIFLELKIPKIIYIFAIFRCKKEKFGPLKDEITPRNGISELRFWPISFSVTHEIFWKVIFWVILLKMRLEGSESIIGSPK